MTTDSRGDANEKPEATEPQHLSEEELALLNAAFDYARTGATQPLAALVGAGLPVNLTNGKGDTLLILAAYYGNSETVSALLSAGADPDRENDRGQTALSAATFRRDEALVQMLLEAGADPHAGTVSAVTVAKQFDLPRFAELFDQEG